MTYIRTSTLLLFLAMLFTLSSCAVIQGIFKLGFWSGLLLAFLVVVMIIVVVYKLLK